MTGWWHRLEHCLRWNYGEVVSALDDRGTVWIAYRCVTCGRLDGKHALYPPPDGRFTAARKPQL